MRGGDPANETSAEGKGQRTAKEEGKKLTKKGYKGREN